MTQYEPDESFLQPVTFIMEKGGKTSAMDMEQYRSAQSDSSQSKYRFSPEAYSSSDMQVHASNPVRGQQEEKTQHGRNPHMELIELAAFYVCFKVSDGPSLK